METVVIIIALISEFSLGFVLGWTITESKWKRRV